MTAQSLRRAMNAELAKQGITLRQWEVLAWIAIQGELSQAELAERLGIEAPTLVGILDRMERDGWLDRYHCPQDRRKKRIRSTDKSETLWLKMVECARTVRAQATQGFSPEELVAFKAMCERIRANLDGAPRGLECGHLGGQRTEIERSSASHALIEAAVTRAADAETETMEQRGASVRTPASRG